MYDEVWPKFCVQADDDFAHDCDDGDHFWFPGGNSRKFARK
jgi:hypothetical protein